MVDGVGVFDELEVLVIVGVFYIFGDGMCGDGGVLLVGKLLSSVGLKVKYESVGGCSSVVGIWMGLVCVGGC